MFSKQYFLFPLIFIAGCANQKIESQSNDWVCMDDSYQIDSNDLPKLIEQANSGDVIASNRLFYYYAIYLRDREQGMKYLVRIANDGNVAAQFNLGVILFYDKDCCNKNEGLKWLKKAADAGDILAKKRLEEITKDQSKDHNQSTDQPVQHP